MSRQRLQKEETIPAGVLNTRSGGISTSVLNSIGSIEPGRPYTNTFAVVPKHETLSSENGVKFNIETVPDALDNHLNKPLISPEQLLQQTQAALNYRYRQVQQQKRPLEAENIPIEAMSQESGGNKKLVHVGPNGLVISMVTAFAQHLPLVLSPDHIWIAISYAFAKHVDLNAEALRSNFVQHDGKKRLLVVTPNGFPMTKGSNPFAVTEQWETHIFPSFSKQIKESIGEYTHEVIAGNFSTTTSASKAAHEITLMSAMKNYFSYGMSTCCGIPHITLLGTEADWVNLRTRAESLGNLMTKEFSALWMPFLLPVLDEFVESYKGNVKYGFWQSMVKLRRKGGSGGYSFISGWMQLLFPYLATGQLNKNLRPWQEMYFAGPKLQEFPPLASSAPVDWDYNGTVFDLEFHSGVLGFEQDSSNGALSPLLGWYVSHTPPKPASVQVRQFKKELEDLLLGHKDEAAQVPVKTDAPWYQRVSFLRQEIQRLEGNGKPEL